ncbi:PAS domain-containing protein [Candidatus Binatia bacterium]|nr:PAS domain-containing protein [Candidatus Binatia bacterium]
MEHKEVEVILTRQLASSLTLPAFIVDAGGTLVFYNEAAERVLGVRFEETGEMPADEWATSWMPTDDAGRPIPAARLPLMVALSERRVAHAFLWVQGLDRTRRKLEAIAFPLSCQGERNLGAMLVFHEVGH